LYWFPWILRSSFIPETYAFAVGKSAHFSYAANDTYTHWCFQNPISGQSTHKWPKSWFAGYQHDVLVEQKDAKLVALTWEIYQVFEPASSPLPDVGHPILSLESLPICLFEVVLLCRGWILHLQRLKRANLPFRHSSWPKQLTEVLITRSRHGY